MKLLPAYLGVVLIWSTTPLAVKLSTDSLDFSFAALARMSLSTLICCALLLPLRVRLRFDRPALKAYASASLGMFGSLSLTYAAVGYIPSGLVSVIFGLAPVVAGVLARFLLGERSLNPVRIGALMLALLGLGVVFSGTLRWEADSWPGLLLSLGSVLMFALSNVLIKRHSGDLHPLQHTTGSLLFTLPLFVLSWTLLDGELPQEISATSLSAVLYLAIVGSVIGFLLYFRVLRYLTATQAALIPLMTPPLAVLLGALFAGEAVHSGTLLGGGLILLALAGFQFDGRIQRLLQGRRAQAVHVPG